MDMNPCALCCDPFTRCRALAATTPVEPLESAKLQLASFPDFALGLQVQAPMSPNVTDLVVANIPCRVLPGFMFDILVKPRSDFPVDAIDNFMLCLEKHLRVSATLFCAGVAVGNIHSLCRRLDAGTCGVALTFKPPSGGPCSPFPCHLCKTTPVGASVIIDGISFSGKTVLSPRFPVRVLVGANHTPSPAGRLHWAMQLEVPSLGRVIDALQAGCSTAEATPHGTTALHVAAVRFNSLGSGASILLALLNLGADVNAQDSMGMTPLHMAVKWLCVAATELILRAPRVDVNLLNFVGIAHLLCDY